MGNIPKFIFWLEILVSNLSKFCSKITIPYIIAGNGAVNNAIPIMMTPKWLIYTKRKKSKCNY